MPFRSLNFLKLQQACCRIFGSSLLLTVFHLGAASGFSPDGGEYALAGSLVADQTAPALAINADGGLIVWQDNAITGGGTGIRARRIGRTLSGSLPAFWVNSKTTGIHERPQVVLLAGGGALFVWRGGPLGQQGIFARVLKAGNSSTAAFNGEDIEIAPSGGSGNTDAAVTRLADNSLVITWASYGSDGSLYGVQAQRLSSVGEKVGPPFQVNVTTAYNQRSSALAPLADGGFAVAWVSENQRFDKSVDIFARIFNSTGSPLSGEVRLNSGTNVCASPSLVGLPNGGFAAAWSEYDYANHQNGWDVYARAFDRAGTATALSTRLNSYQPADQLVPKLSIAGDALMAVWTSYGQDGSQEGVFGRYLSVNAEPTEDEFNLNQTTVSQQKDPAVASDGGSHFVAAWTSFKSLSNGFDLVTRKFVRPASVAAVSCKVTAVKDAAGRVNAVKLSWSAVAGANYWLQTSSNMTAWTDSSATVTVSGTSNSVTLPVSQPGGFFRIVSLP